MEDQETGPETSKDLTRKERKASAAHEVKPSQLERLLTPIEQERIFTPEIDSYLSYAYLLGGVTRLGLEVGQDYYHFCLKIGNPYSKDPDVPSEIKFEDMRILDWTPEYAARFFAQKLKAPSPRAISLPVGYSTKLYTTDSDNPSEAIVGIDINNPDGTFKATFVRGTLSRMEISHSEEVEDNKVLGKYIAFNPLSSTLEVSNYLTTKDPVIEEGYHLFERVERYRKLAQMHGPEIIMERERDLIDVSVEKISAILGIDPNDEELILLLDTLPSVDGGGILKKMLGKAGKKDEADKIVNSLKEGVREKRQAGLSARFKIEKDQLALEDLDTWGKTAGFAQQWKENMLNFANLDGKTLLAPLDRFRAGLDNEFLNIAALVSGKVEAHED